MCSLVPLLSSIYPIPAMHSLLVTFILHINAPWTSRQSDKRIEVLHKHQVYFINGKLRWILKDLQASNFSRTYQREPHLSPPSCAKPRNQILFSPTFLKNRFKPVLFSLILKVKFDLMSFFKVQLGWPDKRFQKESQDQTNYIAP